ncbi:MAG: chorismate mutase [Mycobacterium sp.]|jgi:chorismate mutase|nr:chorismate mutase [Mycobacterium sp.]
MRPEPPHEENDEMTTDELTDIDDLRTEIDRLDAEILAAVKRRTEVSQSIGKVRMASGGTRLVHSREMAVIERYSALGADGKDLAMLLLRMGRGRLGH